MYTIFNKMLEKILTPLLSKPITINGRQEAYVSHGQFKTKFKYLFKKSYFNE